MSDVHFAGNGPHRRRRLLSSDTQTDESETIARSAATSLIDLTSAAFPLLTRDQIMRKIISPRLWKHHVVACLLIALPFLMAGFRLPGQDRESVAQMNTAIRGISGLELFIASQLCLLICWVRAASAVDFAGVFRAWRWMSLVLLVASLLVLTNVSDSLILVTSNWLQSLVGNLDSARPALIFVPCCASLVYVLRYVFPDMGRCRLAQGSMAIAAFLLLARIVVSIRGPFVSSTTFELWELLICGLVLSSVHMHCRYVIYVNPNPPNAIEKPAATMLMREYESDQTPPCVSYPLPTKQLEVDSQPSPVQPGVAAELEAESESLPVVAIRSEMTGSTTESVTSSKKGVSKASKGARAKRRAS